MKKKNKLTFKAFNTFNKHYTHNEEKKEGKYVKSGTDNQFPNYLITLYNRSSINAAAIDAIVDNIVGEGLTANEEAFLETANKSGESWNDIFKKVSLDYKLHGSFALEIIYSLDRSRIAEVYHIDFSLIRAKEKNHRGIIPGYYISNKWKAYMSPNKSNEIQYLPVFDLNKKEEEGSQIFVVHNYRPGQEYYPLPDYNGALKIIELDTEIDNFHANNMKNGLVPSLAITTFMNGSSDDVKAVEELLRANYGGTNNAGQLLYMDVDSPENKPEVTPIQPAATDTYYTTINDLVVQKILTAHRITSPMLLGIKTEGQLGGRTEMIDAQILLQHNVIMPMQQEILRELEAILSVNYPDIVLGVETRTLFDDGTVEEEVITSVEVTDEENEEVQKQDETNVQDI